MRHASWQNSYEVKKERASNFGLDKKLESLNTADQTSLLDYLLFVLELLLEKIGNLTSMRPVIFQVKRPATLPISKEH